MDEKVDERMKETEARLQKSMDENMETKFKEKDDQVGMLFQHT